MAKGKTTRRKPVHKRVDGVNYIIYANGDVRKDLRGGRREGSGRKALAPENQEFHALKLSPKSSLILASVSDKLSKHSDRKVTRRDVVSFIVHRAGLSDTWMDKASEISQFMAAGKTIIRVRRPDYEKILELNAAFEAKKGVKFTSTKLLNVLIYLFGSQPDFLRGH